LDVASNLPHQHISVNNKKEGFIKQLQLQTISGETLMSKPLQPMSFVVDTLLSQGLHILAGSPKAGKSWLALWLAVTVAKGEAVWKMPVKQGTTLYLCLEDSQLRIQNRLFGEKATRSLGLKIGSTSPLPVPMAAGAGTAASTMRRSSRKIWKPSLSTGRWLVSMENTLNRPSAGSARSVRTCSNWGSI